jgi:beta-lactamase superfamily II metal-dependent hydrolase
VADEGVAIELLPAQQGDALWIEYGSAARPSRVLIDGGTPPTVAALRARISSLAPADRHFDLIVVTHVDTDHIGGMLRLMSDPSLGISTDDFWFNGWPQLPGNAKAELLGPIDGEILARQIERAKFPWNAAFGGGPVQVPDDPDAAMPSVTLPGGMRLTVLSPTSVQLASLKRKWRTVLREAGLDGTDLEAGLARAMRRKGVLSADVLGDDTIDVPRDAASLFTPDPAVANSTSIALLAEFGGKRALLTGDAWAPVLEAGIGRLLRQTQAERLRLDVLKVAHHGSKNNTSSSLLERIVTARYLFSSSGAIFHHPDRQAVSRAIVAGARGGVEVELCFNYRSVDNEAWADPGRQRRFRFRATYPEDGSDGHLRVEL